MYDVQMIWRLSLFRSWLSDSGTSSLNTQNSYFGDSKAYRIKWNYFKYSLEILKKFVESCYFYTSWSSVIWTNTMEEPNSRQQLQLRKKKKKDSTKWPRGLLLALLIVNTSVIT